MTGCPSCGSERLKGAPLLVVSPMAELLFVRRRYRCPDCAWRGWKHRLRRLGKPATLILNEAPQARATWFFVLLLALLLTAAVMLVRSCAPSEEQLPAASSVKSSAHVPTSSRNSMRPRTNAPASSIG